MIATTLRTEMLRFTAKMEEDRQTMDAMKLLPVATPTDMTPAVAAHRAMTAECMRDLQEALVRNVRCIQMKTTAEMLTPTVLLQVHHSQKESIALLHLPRIVVADHRSRRWEVAAREDLLVTMLRQYARLLLKEILPQENQEVRALRILREVVAPNVAADHQDSIP